MSKGWILGLVLLAACGHGPSVPDPLPSATPAPPSSFHPPLRATAGGFVDASGKLVALRGASYFPPDSKAYGWPSRVSRAKLEQIHGAGMNMVAVRLGPFIESSEGADQVAYAAAGGRVDLDSWNDSFWAELEAFLNDAQSLEIYVELDMVDSWGLERRLNPWARENNVNGIDEGDCSILSRVATANQRKWLAKIAEIVSRHPNTLLQISNESGAGNCRNTLVPAWELSIYNYLKGLGLKTPIGTNSEDPAIERSVDYVERHSCANSSSDRPMGVNEWNCALSIPEFCERQREAVASGGWFLLWGDNMSLGDWEEGLKCPR